MIDHNFDTDELMRTMRPVCERKLLKVKDASSDELNAVCPCFLDQSKTFCPHDKNCTAFRRAVPKR